MKAPRLSLGQVFVLAELSLAVLLLVLYYGISAGSQRSLLATSELVRHGSSMLIAQRLQTYLDGADQAISSLERRIQLGVFDARDPLAVESELFSIALDHPSLTDISLTRADEEGFDETGRMLLKPGHRFRVAVYRDSADSSSPLFTEWVRPEAGHFAIDERIRSPGGSLFGSRLRRRKGPEPPDPTEHLTFVTPTSRDLYERSAGDALWSDLSFVERDSHLPEPSRRVVVTALRAVRDGGGRFAGVVRAGLRTEAVDRIVWDEQAHSEPMRVFLCDEQGRLVSRLSAGDPLVEQADGSLRVAPKKVPVELDRSLRAISLRDLGPDNPETSARVSAEGRAFLATFRNLPRTQDWRVGVVVAEDRLPGLREQAQLRFRLLIGALLMSGVIFVGGFLTLVAIRGGLSQIASASSRMRDFDFRPAEARSPFRDVEGVMQGLELAKTAMRAMSKYVPVGLVRLLYETGREPTLGGQLARVSLLFTDIKGFTSLSEQLSPNELARRLGRYLEVMTEAIQKEGGTIDKYIGDAIMAVWNVPTPCDDHPRRACEAMLKASSAAERLFRSAEWEGCPPFTTRFGIHTDDVIVGHFGAPDRMSYTCLGDGVNLAARLEALNKQYGTSVLVSETTRQAVGDSLAFRLVDSVAVKGKRTAVAVYELLGPASDQDRLPIARRYEEAFSAYRRRDFSSALKILETQLLDGPSAVLADRCRAFIRDPPPPDWDGVHVATSK